MRDIFFRGKRKDNGEWVEGSLILTTSTMEKPFIVDSCWCYSGSVDDEGYAKFEYLNAYEVIPETVGQYTGLTDKNGKKIFEGDIVKAQDDIFGSPFCNGITGKVVYDETAFFIEPKDVMETQWLFNECAVYEVIGNMTDNPELLKGGD